MIVKFPRENLSARQLLASELQRSDVRFAAVVVKDGEYWVYYQCEWEDLEPIARVFEHEATLATEGDEE